MIEIKNVSFSYGEGENSLKNINMKVRPGECVLLCGSSGCGKTTLTKLCNGLIPHFEQGCVQGETIAAGMNVATTPLYLLSQKVGSVFQNPKSQFFNIDSDSELAFGLENCGTAPELIRKRIGETAEQLQIHHLLHRNVFSMSGGEKQALAFASVYAMDPDIYVLDEPSANLDSEATELLHNQIMTIKAQGKTIIIAEHRLYYLTDLIDRAIYIEGGVIKKEYTREHFLSLTEDERRTLGLRTVKAQRKQVTQPPESSGTLEIHNLSVKIKGRIIFENLSFAASPGRVLGITGHNGAGKSTLLRTVAGLQKESSGEIYYEGRRLNAKERNKLCYMIMQDVNHQLFGDSVWNECILSCQADADEKEISRALSAYDLLEFKDKHPMALSGGQKQRLAIVTGIAAGKKVLMFDEPSSGLDYTHMRTVSNTLRSLAAEGHIVMVVTHDLELLNSCCDQILHLGDITGGIK